MPSRDANGNRLGGAAQRALKAVNNGGGASKEIAAMPVPPIAKGVVAVEEWAAELGARCLVAAERGEDLARVRWLQKGLRKLGQLKDKARLSWLACGLLRQYEEIEVDLEGETRPAQALGVVAWAYYRLAKVLHAIATDPDPLSPEKAQLANLIIEAAATLGYLPLNAAHDELEERIKAKLNGYQRNV
jgi:hypothetical protein